MIAVARGERRSLLAFVLWVEGGGGSRPDAGLDLSSADLAVLAAIAYLQPLTRGELTQAFGVEVNRDRIARLRGADLIAAGPRSPLPGAPPTYVTTPAFLALFGFSSLRDLPDVEAPQDAGLLDRAMLSGNPLRIPGVPDDHDEVEADPIDQRVRESLGK